MKTLNTDYKMTPKDSSRRPLVSDSSNTAVARPHPAAISAGMVFITLLGLIALYLYGAGVVQKNVITNNLSRSPSLSAAANNAILTPDASSETILNDSNPEPVEITLINPPVEQTSSDLELEAKNDTSIDSPIKIAPTSTEAVIFFDNQPLN